MRATVAVPVAGLLLGGCGDVIEAQRQDTTVAYQKLREDEITNADIWDEKPRILAAGLGFTSIIGVPNLSTDNLGLSRTLTHLAGGAWNTVSCAPGQTPSLVNYTSASTPESVANGFGQEVFFSDGLPIEFSWPLLPAPARRAGNPSRIHADVAEGGSDAGCELADMATTLAALGRGSGRPIWQRPRHPPTPVTRPPRLVPWLLWSARSAKSWWTNSSCVRGRRRRTPTRTSPGCGLRAGRRPTSRPNWPPAAGRPSWPGGRARTLRAVR